MLAHSIIAHSVVYLLKNILFAGGSLIFSLQAPMVCLKSAYCASCGRERFVIRKINISEILFSYVQKLYFKELERLSFAITLKVRKPRGYVLSGHVEETCRYKDPPEIT